MEIRAKWNKMIDADKCQYNGYSDFHTKESNKRQYEKKQADKDK